jgi:hypothetical protein
MNVESSRHLGDTSAVARLVRRSTACEDGRVKTDVCGEVPLCGTKT